MLIFKAISVSKRISTLLLCICVSITSLISTPLPLIRISVENTKSHVQTKSVQRFVDLITQQLEGLYDIEFYPSASLFKDADIFRALAQGKVEIAVPGTWHFDKAVPEVGMFLLPSLYGRAPFVSYELMKSEAGKSIINSIESNINVKVLGSFIDLGPTQIFSTDTPIFTVDDFANKRIRVAGGIGNSLRLASLGATPVTIAWPALPLALKKNSIDALLTSYETIVSAELYQYGINYVYEDNQYFAQYVPIVSCTFWQKLTPEIQNIIQSSWEEIVDKARSDAKKAQEDAESIMRGKNITIIRPRDEVIRQTRNMLMQDEKAIAQQIGIPPDTYAQFFAFFKDIDNEEPRIVK